MRNILVNLFLFITLGVLGNKEFFKKLDIQPEVTYKGTFLLPHSGSVYTLMNGNFGVYEIGAQFQKWGNKEFHKSFPFHAWGINAVFTPTSSPEFLGFGAGVVPYIDINLKRHKYSSWTFRLGTGLGYIQKPFNNISNPKNMVIGTHINNITDLSLLYNLPITVKYRAKIGFGLQHFSNGATIRPNLGLNHPYLSLTVGHYKTKKFCKPMPRDTTNEKSTPYIQLSYGTKTLEFGGTEFYDIVQTAIGYSFGFKRGKLLHLQADIIFDESTPHLKTYDFELNPYFKWIVGLFGLYEKKYGQVGFLFGSGFYLFSPYQSFSQDWSYANKGGNFYNRLGIKYYIRDHWNAQIMIRSHTGEADNIEFGMGYRF